MSSPLNKLIDSVVSCTICGSKFGTCKCWVKCVCGWFRRNGKKCNNPIHKKNSLNNGI